MTWDQVKEAFLDRFVPFSLKDQMRDEFDRLDQGSIIVANMRHDSMPYLDILMPVLPHNLRRFGSS